MRFRTVVALALAASVLAGCAAPRPSDATPGGEEPAWPRCAHPWPCADGTEWPAGLAGPFEPGEVVEARYATSAGGLDALLVRPVVPEGVRVPLVIEATPYMRQGDDFAPGSPLASEAWLDGLFFRPLVEAGYAFARVSVPGTGASDGCFDNYGPRTQRALADLVEAMAAEPWSNGRVGMMGISAAGTTPFAAAVENPPALKTVIAAGIESNVYLFAGTPQGAFRGESPEPATYSAGVTLSPPAGAPVEGLAGYPTQVPDRLCPDVVAYMVGNQAGATGDRGEAFWEPRILVQRFPNVTASVFVDHGLLDVGGHAFQEDDVWHALDAAPKRMMLGQWGHRFPDARLLAGYEGGADPWANVTIPWLDFWLKGVGEPPRLGIVDWQDDAGAWHASAAWPPDEAREEALHLDAGRLSPAPGSAASSFRAYHAPESTPTLLCGSLTPVPGGVGFMTEPATGRTVVAGNAFVHLRMTSDAPAGLVMAVLYDLAPGFDCGGATDETRIARGAADLQYHAGNLRAKDFPTGAPQDLRIDLWNFAHVLEKGHRLALVIRGPPADEHYEALQAPLVTLGPESRLVLPVAEGTLGGATSFDPPPPKPFVPT